MITGLTIFAGCDCLQKISGKVVDSETNLPIDSVYIQIENDYEHNVFTDNHGEFELTAISGGLYNCPDMTVVISKSGYETLSAEIKLSVDTTIKMRKLRF